MRKIKLIKNLTVISTIPLIFISAIFALPVFSSSTDGTIDSIYKYAWGENIGWLNFGTTEGNIHVTDSALTGYIWAENIGWISLNCSNGSSCATVDYKVANDGEGTLIGYAWSENTGWINFNPTYGGVTINSSGEFLGYAWGENIGWIVFNCSTINSCATVDYKVKTDWRLGSVRNRAGLPVEYSSAPAPAAASQENIQGGFKIVINNGVEITPSRAVILRLFAGADTARMAISNNPEFSGIGSTGQMVFQSFYEWDICRGMEKCVDGEYKVYARFFADWGTSSEVISDGIVYQKEIIALLEEKPVPIQVKESIVKLLVPEVEPPIKPPVKPIVEKIPKILRPFVPEFFMLKQPEEPPQIAIENLVPKETPLAFQGKWQLLPIDSIREFVLAPLPKSIRNLAQKFPELEKTLGEVGVSKITDVAKLKSVKLTLPGLTERAGPEGVPPSGTLRGKLALPKGLPIAKLSPQMKRQLPTEIVFAKTGGELIDFNIDLSVSDKGEPQQKIATISGKPLQLVVKPDKPVKSVKGYVVFKSKASQPTSLELPLNSLLASVIFANPVFAHPVRNEPLVFVEGALPQSYPPEGIVAGIAEISNGAMDQPVRVEEKLVLLGFEYTDPDGDGIYTAEIQASLIEGEYEIITVMDFEDPELGKKEIRLTMVIDPEGYLYEKDGDKETRIPGVIISLYWLNPEIKQYEMWPAREYQQENPQTTDVRGTYSFLVPAGYYYLKAEAPGYLVYDGKPFQVKEGSGIHINIELKTKYWWLNIVDWKTILLTIITILLLYNFYRDIIREKLLKR